MHDDVTVGGGVDVQFDRIRAQLAGGAKCGQRVLRPGSRRSPMRDYEQCWGQLRISIRLWFH